MELWLEVRWVCHVLMPHDNLTDLKRGLLHAQDTGTCHIWQHICPVENNDSKYARYASWLHKIQKKMHEKRTWTASGGGQTMAAGHIRYNSEKNEESNKYLLGSEIQLCSWNLTFQEICIIMHPSSQRQKAERGKMRKTFELLSE